MTYLTSKWVSFLFTRAGRLRFVKAIPSLLFPAQIFPVRAIKRLVLGWNCSVYVCVNVTIEMIGIYYTVVNCMRHN